METGPFIMYLISLLFSLYTINGKVSDKTEIQSNASIVVNFDKK